MEIEHIRNAKGLVEGFEIQGVSKELRLRFSKRRAEVEAAIDKLSQNEDGSRIRPRSPKWSANPSAKVLEISTTEGRRFQVPSCHPQSSRLWNPSRVRRWIAL